jgi:cardiolipin synthase A/B
MLFAASLHWLIDFWPHVGVVLNGLLSLVASAHAVLHKRDTRAAIAWVGVIWLTPILGTLLYVWLGINRIRRKAHSLRADESHPPRHPDVHACSEAVLADTLTPRGRHLHELVRLVGKVTERPLLCGNEVTPLVGSDEAYPAMLEAIEAAQRSITLCTYIFNNDPTGDRFASALGRAVQRGVEVRVLIDAIGARYTWPTIFPKLKQAGVHAAAFLPPRVPMWFAYSNLRNHRKILVVDGQIGFTGGMNIRESAEQRHVRIASIQDLHFRIRGPAVWQLQSVFADDWEFSTRECLEGDLWFPRLELVGPLSARGISDGPDKDLDKLRLTLLGAVACAESSVQIMTPYFLPDAALITSLNVAAMRGVRVDILLPAQNNLAMVQWASAALYWQVLEHGCRIWHTPPPFEHTKLMVVDELWTLLGSGNWDPRSLRLNFEFNVECYGATLGKPMSALLRKKLERARPVTRADVDGRPLPIKLRDGVARLFSPYL